MREDRIVLYLGLLAFTVLVVVSVITIQHATIPEHIPTQALPIAQPSGTWDPSAGACEQAGGTVVYERTTECTDPISVSDACGYGLLCFFPHESIDCHEARRAVCSCTTTDQCPQGYACDASRCHPQALVPKPL